MRESVYNRFKRQIELVAKIKSADTCTGTGTCFFRDEVSREALNVG